MKMLLGLSETLPSLVEAKFASARATSGLLFSPSEVSTIRTSTGFPFQLRFCPTLAKKPTPKNEEPTPKRKFDPFESPPAALHIADIPKDNPSHLLVLNKFPIIAQHFILATKSNKQQTHFLEQDDLEATFACLNAWQATHSKQTRLFAFFNSGEHSGASQSHRHLQFLPLESMLEGGATGSWDLLIDLILSSKGTQAKGAQAGLKQHDDLPFIHYACSLGPNPSGPELVSNYKELYRAAKDAVDTFIATSPEEFALHPDDEGDSPISYNLAMTTSGMAILPRRSEGTMLQRDDGSEIGFVALNGTTLGGTMMVKYQEEWDLLRERPAMLDNILAAIGIPRPYLTTFKSRV
ncbi:Ap4A phosphorylase-like protein II [Ampelomyces quisqualis]|uniref:Ap4A phosphorylase-like protein II n=1 Tax=Ampelomyces quisqualis TaxID=50730 RepID=A0A6A5QIT8_AMPQU|nr:Ap4A phosphorylase-like protein II [Ampelomyces quisqualis]